MINQIVVFVLISRETGFLNRSSSREVGILMIVRISGALG